MGDLYDLLDDDICQPEWLSDFIHEEFAEYFHHYDDELDFTDFIYPIESDGVTDYFFQSQLFQILHLHSRQEVEKVVNYLRSIDLLQREYLPSEHFESLRFLVSFILFFAVCETFSSIAGYCFKNFCALIGSF